MIIKQKGERKKKEATRTKKHFFVCKCKALIAFLHGNLDWASAKQIRYKLKVRAKGSPQQGSIEWQAQGPPMHGLQSRCSQGCSDYWTGNKKASAYRQPRWMLVIIKHPLGENDTSQPHLCNHRGIIKAPVTVVNRVQIKQGENLNAVFFLDRRQRAM